MEPLTLSQTNESRWSTKTACAFIQCLGPKTTQECNTSININFSSESNRVKFMKANRQHPSSVCRVCRIEPIGIRFMPCKNQICCVYCALSTNECQQCQFRVDERLTLEGATLSSQEENPVQSK